MKYSPGKDDMVRTYGRGNRRRGEGRDPQWFTKRYEKLKAKHPTYNWGAAPTDRESFKAMMSGFKDWRKTQPGYDKRNKMTGPRNSLSRRTGNLDRFKSMFADKMSSNPKFADMIAKKQAMIDKFKNRIGTTRPPAGSRNLIKTPYGVRLPGKPDPTATQTMKSGGKVKRMNMGGMMKPMGRLANPAITGQPAPVVGPGDRPIKTPTTGRPSMGWNPVTSPAPGVRPEPSWKPKKPASGNYGQMVSAAAKARNMARKAAKGGPTIMKAGGLVKANGCAQRGKTKGKMC